MTILAVFNQKGGVGKTTSTANLAAAMAREGMEPLIIDLDPQAHLTAISGIEIDSDESIFAFYRDNKPLTELVKRMDNSVIVNTDPVACYIQPCCLQNLFD